jgi:hypothetical protein
MRNCALAGPRDFMLALNEEWVAISHPLLLILEDFTSFLLQLSSQCPLGNTKNEYSGTALGSNFFIKIGPNSTNFLESATNLQI